MPVYNKRELTFNKCVINQYIINLPICHHLISHEFLVCRSDNSAEFRMANLLFFDDLLAGS
jgi:hypothetical protein